MRNIYSPCKCECSNKSSSGWCASTVCINPEHNGSGKTIILSEKQNESTFIHKVTKGEMAMAIKVTCDVPTYNNPAKGNIQVHSHWNGSDMVEIEINGERYEVYGNDLITAINDCMNKNQLW